MKVLAIDPGPVVSGWVLFDSDAQRVLEAGKEDPTSDVLEFVRRGETPGGRSWEMVACEMIASYGMPVGADVFETCVQIGRLMEVWESTTGGHVVRVKRQKAKLLLCQSSRAKDANVSQALKDRFGEVGTAKNPGPLFGVAKHAWAALAVAVFASEVGEGM